MKAVSTSMTLFLKWVVPLVWTVFFGTLTFAFYKMDFEFIGPFPAGPFRIGMTIFTLIGVAVFYWLVMRILRVDMDDKFIYVTNYFKTYRYPYHQIERMEEKPFGFFRSVDIHLKQKGHFGKKITFLASRKKYEQFVREHPKAFQNLLK